MNKLLTYLLFTLILSSLVGCANVNSHNSNRKISDAAHESGKDMRAEYTLQLGDIVDIKFYYNPELNETVTIRPDGKISLQLIDEIMAAGLTPSELDKILTEKYSKRLRYADIAVIVKEFANLRVYVGGEVNSPRVILLNGKITLLQAILQVGGFKSTAELTNVMVMRNQGTEQPLFLSVDIRKDLTTGKKTNDILLKPGDIIFVPKTGIASLAEFVDQYVNELVPTALSFGLVYNLNPEVTVK